MMIDLMTGLFIVLIFMFGVTWGSFLMLVGIRLPKGKSVVWPHSSCPHCNKQIKGINLWPIVGWIWNKGHCRQCKVSISPLYPFIELVSGLSLVMLYLFTDSTYELIILFMLTSVLITISVSDLLYRLIPNKIIFPMMLITIIFRIIYHPLPILQYVLGFLIGGGLLYLVSYVFVKLNKPAMGGGDIKLMALLGLALGINQVMFILLFSSLIGMVVGLLLILAKKMSRNEFIPFGPYIALAGFIAMIWGDPIVHWYLDLFRVL